jgi:sodium/potassium-transporting ATPase subunit beta
MVATERKYSPQKGGHHTPHKKALPPKSSSYTFYDAKAGTFLGRTPTSWASIIIFYIIFYASLAAFWCICFYVFYLTLNMDKPKYQLEESLIGTNPGLGFRPMPDPNKSPDSTLIWFRQGQGVNDADYKFWTRQLEKIAAEIETGNTTAGSKNLHSCSFTNGRRATEDRACQVENTNFQDCTANNQFGYRLGEPCVLIKLNKIYGWVPQPYGYRDNGVFDLKILEEDLRSEQKEKRMPLKLAEQIYSYATNIKIPNHLELETYRRGVLSTVWISCDGENVADTENIGPILYFPMPGIAGYYFPYMKQQGYQSPFIFVQFKRPHPGVVINVECKAFAKNVKPDKMMRLASTHFELLID